jgi:hypothetical protein
MSDKRSSAILAIAIVLLLVNVGLFVTGVRWAGGVMEEVSRDTESESLRRAGERVDEAERVVDNALRVALWVTGFGFVVLAVVGVHFLARSSRRTREADSISSYRRNVARAQHRDRRRRHEKAAAP